MATTFDDDAARARACDDGVRAFDAMAPLRGVVARDGDVGSGARTYTYTFRGVVGPAIARDDDETRLECVPFSMASPFVDPSSSDARDAPLVMVMHPSYSSAAAMEPTLELYAARLQCFVASFDAPHHGARGGGEDVRDVKRRATTAYAKALVDCYARDDATRYGGRPYIVDGAVDCLRVCRAMRQKFGVRRVGLTGVSLGGMMATMAAARWSNAWTSSADVDVRMDWTVVACAPIIGFSDFRWALMREESWRARIMSLPSEMRDVVFENGERPTRSETFEFWTRALSGVVARDVDDDDDDDEGARDGADNLLRILQNGIDFLAVQGDEDARNPMRGVEAALARCARLSRARGSNSSTITIASQRNVRHEVTDAMHDVVQKFLADRIHQRDAVANTHAFEPASLNRATWRVLAFDAKPHAA